MQLLHVKTLPIALAALAFAPVALAANPVGFNFMDPADNAGGSAGYYQVNEGLAPTDVAGVVPQTNWNNMVQGGTGIPPGVLVQDGIRITWATPCGGTANLGAGPSTADYRLMRGYLDNCDDTNSPDVVKVYGQTFPLYDVICYTVGRNGSATRVSKFTLTSTNNGVLFTNLTKYVQDDGNSVFDGSTYIEADSTNDYPNAASGNYCRFYNVRGTNFTIRSVGAFASDGHPRGPFNALQIVPIDVTPVLSNPTYANGQFQCFLNGATNATYVLQSSTDFLNWQPVSTNVAPAQVSDSPPANPPYRFYRAQFQ